MVASYPQEAAFKCRLLGMNNPTHMAAPHIFKDLSRFDHCYFITTNVAGKQPLFDNQHNARIFFQILKRTQKIVPFQVIAYCLMPDHLHILIRVFADDINMLPKIMKFLKGTSARKINKRHKQQGTLWQEGYWETLVRGTKARRRVIRYIHQNPVTAGIVESQALYSYSSAYQQN